jgi:hypothetical protein
MHLVWLARVSRERAETDSGALLAILTPGVSCYVLPIVRTGRNQWRYLP